MDKYYLCDVSVLPWGALQSPREEGRRPRCSSHMPGEVSNVVFEFKGTLLARKNNHLDLHIQTFILVNIQNSTGLGTEHLDESGLCFEKATEPGPPEVPSNPIYSVIP